MPRISDHFFGYVEHDWLCILEDSELVQSSNILRQVWVLHLPLRSGLGEVDTVNCTYNTNICNCDLGAQHVRLTLGSLHVLTECSHGAFEFPQLPILPLLVLLLLLPAQFPAVYHKCIHACTTKNGDLFRKKVAVQVAGKQGRTVVDILLDNIVLDVRTIVDRGTLVREEENWKLFEWVVLGGVGC